MAICNDMVLFQAKNGIVTAGDIKNALKKIDADNCKVLFVHTDLSFGTIPKGLKRKELCAALLEIILSLGVETVVFPTFTFSYGNKQDFDVRTTPTKMGILNEYVRRLPDAFRSVDPMMSVVVLGKNHDLLNVTGVKSLGEGSIFDNLHHTPEVKFLFLGTKVGLCGTHMHYVEEKLRVPYRYDMDFYGHILDYEGKMIEDHRILYVKYRDIIPSVPQSFEDELLESGKMKFSSIGDTYAYAISEKDFFDTTMQWLSRDVNSLLAEPYTTHPLVKEYSYGNVTTVQ